MKNQRVTREQCEQIVALNREGKLLQKEIAAQLNLNVDTVRKIERQAGRLRHPGYRVKPEQEREIVRLLQDENWGQPRISRALGIPAHAVRQVMLLHRFRMPQGMVGARYRFTSEQLRAIARDLRNNERRIAAKWNVTHEWLRRFRNEQLKNYQKGHKPAQPVSDSDKAVHLVDAFVDKVFGGLMPEDSAILEALTAKFVQDFRQQAEEAIKTCRLQRTPDANAWTH